VNDATRKEERIFTDEQTQLSRTKLTKHFCTVPAQRFALAAGGRDKIRFESRKKPEARKMLENAAESHQSAARFVGWRLI
jgi:hypothetical protein